MDYSDEGRGPCSLATETGYFSRRGLKKQAKPKRLSVRNVLTNQNVKKSSSSKYSSTMVKIPFRGTVTFKRGGRTDS